MTAIVRQWLIEIILRVPCPSQERAPIYTRTIGYHMAAQTLNRRLLDSP